MTGGCRSARRRSTSDPERLARIAAHVRGILTELGLDLADPNLAETDRRVAKMYAEMFHGLQEGAEPPITVFPNDERYSAMVMEKRLPFYSMCAHHLVPFYGHAHLAYIPGDRSSVSRSSHASSSSTPSARSSRSG
jgi:GTP cyclohydrolase I